MSGMTFPSFNKPLNDIASMVSSLGVLMRSFWSGIMQCPLREIVIPESLSAKVLPAQKEEVT
ncbi:MAG: hypothetical protein CR997_00170 [Acidobacteria bacterium]|nr:MAG: hypothetical protein CR997_00170 [Acidobacteriota bacterium]